MAADEAEQLRDDIHALRTIVAAAHDRALTSGDTLNARLLEIVTDLLRERRERLEEIESASTPK